MKNIIITGSKGYISTSLKKYLNSHATQFSAECISLKNKEWLNKDFKTIDAVIHCAALVHKNEQRLTLNDYIKINSDLTYDLAMKCKSEGVKHFVFFSTMSVYGINTGIIDRNSETKPETYYGKSKLHAEKKLLGLSSKEFVVSIVRPPMIYGEDSPGNYRKLSRLSNLTLFFPEIHNERSMLFIKNLEKYIKEILIYKSAGIYHPQNKEYVSTLNLVKEIRRVKKKRTIPIKFFNKFILFLAKRNNNLDKIFGTLLYEKNIDRVNFNSNMIDFKKTIYISEVGSEERYE